MDQTLVSMINATLSEPVFTQVVGLSTSREVWNYLQRNFSQHSLANTTHLHFQLLSTSKGTKTISEYLQHTKSLADALAAINEPVSNGDLITSILRGLGQDFAMLITAIINFPPLPVFSDLRAQLLSFESQFTHSTSNDASIRPSTTPPTALLSSSGRGRSSHGGRNRRYGNGGRSDSSSYSYVDRDSYDNGGRSRSGRQSSPSILGRPPPIEYQICSRLGHSAATCYQRYRHDNQLEDDHSLLLLVCRLHNLLIQTGIPTLVLLTT